MRRATEGAGKIGKRLLTMSIKQLLLARRTQRSTPFAFH
jgi:hypothetical protein